MRHTITVIKFTVGYRGLDTHIQPETANCADLALRQGRQDTRDGLDRAGLLAWIQDRQSREGAHRHVLAVEQSQPDIDLRIDRLSNQDARGIGLGDEAHEAWER